MDDSGRLYWRCKCGEDVYSVEEECPKCGTTHKGIWEELFEGKTFTSLEDLTKQLRANHEKLQREKP